MPRASAASLAVLPSPSPRLEPPPDLTGPARQIFDDIVAGLPAEHFSPEDAHLVAAYARCLALEANAARRLEAEPSIDNVTVLARLASATLAYARRLRLGPLGRDHHRRAPTKVPASAASYYEQMRGEA